MTFKPIAFDANLYVDGCKLSWASTTTLTVGTGAARDSLDSLDIEVGSLLTINAAVTGANGLDAGSLVNSTVYYVFLIADPQAYKAVAAMISTSATAPVMPLGYACLRRVGRVRTDGSAHFLPFIAEGAGLTRFVQFDTPLAVLTGGASTTFAAIDLLIGAPASRAVPVYLNATYTPTAAASVASIRPTGSSAASLSCPVELKSNVDDIAVKIPMIKILPLVSSGVPKIDYLVTTGDALTLAVAAFDEIL